VIRARCPIAFAAVVLLLWGGPAYAQGLGRVAEEPGAGSDAQKPAAKDPLRGSTLSIEQSLSTQTAGLNPVTQQTYHPYYGFWVSLRPRWYFDDYLRLQARLDYFKELTNDEQTTYYREDVLGDAWTDLVMARPLASSGRWRNTKVTLGARAVWPLSKQSQGSGLYFSLGPIAGLSQSIPLAGPGAPALNAARLALSFVYLHAFTRATTPTDYGSFATLRENVDDHSFVSDQISGQTLVGDTLVAIVDSGLQLTPKLGLTLDLVWIDQWHHSPSSASISTLTGPVAVPRTGDKQFTQLIWDVLALDYELLDEVALGLGYYNLTNVIASDGEIRSPFAGGQDTTFWSPDARLFFDVTINLDKVVEDVRGRNRRPAESPHGTADAARSARISSVTSWR
jgi:hypothetical protein